MKIIFLQDDFPPQSLGGSGAVAFNLAKAIKQQGHFVYVITAVQNATLEGEYEYEELKILRIYSKYHERWAAYLSLYNPETVGKVKEAIRRIKPDVVHVHNIHHYLSYHCLKLAKQSGAKVFLTAHDVMLFNYGKMGGTSTRISPWQQMKKYKKRYNPFRNITIKYYLKYVDRIIAVSQSLKDVLNQNYIRNVEVIHNGIDTNDWQVDASITSAFKEKYNLQDKKIVLFAGRLSEAKGGNQAIHAMVEVVREVPNAALLVAGTENAYTGEMKILARTLGIAGNLIFVGWLSGDELKAMYRNGEVLIAPSICFDAFPTTILEAMACGKPVVTTCFGGAKEMVSDGETGYIVNPFDVTLLAGKITELLVHSDKARTFGEAGLERIKNDFNLEKMAREYLDTYAGMC
ncbi:MAG: hypothetical protein A3G52_02275 [Candidatus Taylorbacteria bacterium RIFCSPLOWO2_12_FULL_43_20]|uniref:Glycosyl transferase family 1 n=1 Tax=Candidatus Taylorbacteria bacterium RIFCSPLOWO2_12_FULL_43_20 TaxID=1802332 RepID=A0A1G2P5E6_9BACT|nr:MAG: hypothetical protein A3E92_02670 [Candidatus Taylorbacteria bacterium RIFCSPHIGHO2_12_FULL_42_34]OHA42919.1 MAG: hypothetical protein A3G52_02275 [Candidatus Taylorbacteria bacterium RIFCSPLOWO2_12_FULL_43_20]